MTITAAWHELVTVSLLGTDRRDPPEVPPGPVADVVADATRDTPSERMLAAVAATVAARRAGFRPHPPATLLAAPAPDDRPLLPAAAARRWRDVVARWPVLEDEWLDAVRRRGFRLAPDTLVGLLHRHRTDAVRRRRVELLAGALGAWLVDQQPELAAPAGRRAAPDADPAADPAADRDDWVPALAVAPELVAVLDEGSRAVVDTVVAGFTRGGFGLAYRGVLVNFVARVPRHVLTDLAAALHGIDESLAGAGIARTLADLATTRHDMLEELEP